jgi:ABC-2 type transport system ATP-binding protein
VRAETEALNEALERLEGVTQVEITAIENSDHLSVVVESESGRDLRSAIAASVIGGGFDLYELRAVSLSLEDIFLQLTTEEHQPAKEQVAAGV